MSSHQLNSAFTVAKYRDASAGSPPPLHSADVRHPARPHRLPARPDHDRLVRALLRDRARGRLRRARPAGSGAGEDPELVGNGIIIVSIAALIGGRLYHVIDQWALYADAPITVILPITIEADGSVRFAGFAGLGVYGGIVTGTLAAWWYTRRHHVSFARWADIIAPALFVMQAIGRWGNYFNQELYGPPTNLPWGIPIDCAHRLSIYACDIYPEATTRFHPLFLYESISGLLGAAFLVSLGFRYRSWLRPGDLLLVFFIWYGTTRFVLETCAPTTGRSSGSRPRRSSRWRSSASASSG